MAKIRELIRRHKLNNKQRLFWRRVIILLFDVVIYYAVFLILRLLFSAGPGLAYAILLLLLFIEIADEYYPSKNT